MKKLRVLFIVPYPSEGASNRLRVEQYLPYLAEEGIEYRVRPFVGRRFYRILYLRGRWPAKIGYLILSVMNRLADIARACSYDIVFVHREAWPLGSPAIEKIFSWIGKRLVFDFDDAIFLPGTSASNNAMERLKNPNKIKAIIQASDCVIAGNGYLAQYAQKFNDTVVIIPTPIDTGAYTPAERRSADRLTIGWIGSFTTRVYLEQITHALETLRMRYPGLRLKFVGNWAGYNGRIAGAEYKEWSLPGELDDIRSFDIGIMPMPDDMWTRGKCALKIILYMACGIPVVSSPVGMNREVIREGENGLFASREEEWVDKLSRLLDDGPLRERIGAAGRETVERSYAVRQTAPLFVATLNKVAARV